MILKGQKVILRTVRLEDAPRFVRWFNDPTVTKFLLMRCMKLNEEVKWIKDRLKNPPANKLHFCIDTIDGEHIGACGLDDIHERNSRAEIGIMIGNKKFWNKGYGTDAMKVLIDYTFKKLKLHRLGLNVYDYNDRAIRVYENLGFKLEGKVREANFYNKKFRDFYYMGLLDREWKKRSK